MLTAQNLMAGDKEFIDSIFQKLIVKIPQPESYNNWPPSIVISNENIFNAYLQNNNNNGKKLTNIIITQKLVNEIVKSNPSRLAFILGHELAHITENHKNLQSSGKLAQNSFSRKQELEADIIGLQYALQSGFLYREAINTLTLLKGMDDVCSFEGISKDHPTFTARLKNLDSSNKNLWQSMDAYDKGVYFLGLVDYDKAEACFKDVLSQFENCYEAWLNLGYIKLMKYIASLPPDDIKKLNTGHFVSGMYYSTSGSLISKGLRNNDYDPWIDAITDIKFALKLNKKLSLGYANLGLAYLVHPSLTPDYEKAIENFDLANTYSKEDESISEQALIALRINSILATIRITKPDDIEQEFEKIANSFIENDKIDLNFSNELSNIITFNKAFAMMDDDIKIRKTKAKDYFELYLKNTSKSDIWCRIATDYYRNMNVKIDNTISCKTVKETIRPIIEIEYEKTRLKLGEDIYSLNSFLSTSGFTKTDILNKFQLHSYIAPNNQFEIIGDIQILGFIIKSNNGPSVNLINKVGNVVQLSTGAKFSEFNKLINCQECYYQTSILDKKRKYIYYPDLNIALKVNNKNVITEIFITKIQ